MTAALLIAAAASAAVVSWFLTGGVRRYALARSVLDIPNARSSHSVPTPRGGGLAIVSVVFVGVGTAAVLGVIGYELAFALAGGGILVAGIGWLDDHRSVPARVRALVHFGAAAWAVAWLGGLPTVRVGSSVLSLGPVGMVLATLGIVWAINLFNFMDGIDGIAGGEAVTIGLTAGVLLWMDGDSGLAMAAVLLAAASAGFLAWNWAPAKIFMGDVGSGPLGFFIAVLAIASERVGALPLLGWVLLAGVFVFDATATLARRVAHGERWYEAHHSHAYQRAIQEGWTHSQVSGAVLLINGLLGLLAAVGWRWPELLAPLVLAGFAMLSWLYVWVERIRPMYPRPETKSAAGAPDGATRTGSGGGA